MVATTKQEAAVSDAKSAVAKEEAVVAKEEAAVAQPNWRWIANAAAPRER